MSVMNKISGITILRRIFLPLLRTVSFDLNISHDWVPSFKIHLNSFLHKGYWFYGKNRERQSMELFAELIPNGGSVVEVGGHIGYIAAYFASLVGKTGELLVFEPGSNNLSYIRKNVASISECDSLAKVKLVEKAVGPNSGIVEFFEDNLTGQNNSIIKDFKGLEDNSKNAFVQSKVNMRTVDMISLDEYLNGTIVDFVKIDVEGFEYGVLQGMTVLLKTQQPIVMVEVQASEIEIFTLFTEGNYDLFKESRVPVKTVKDMSDNIFCLHREKHKKLISEIFTAKR
jgi:FkbM family methyltransferase